MTYKKQNQKKMYGKMFKFKTKQFHSVKNRKV